MAQIPIGELGEALIAFLVAHFQVPVAVFSGIVEGLYNALEAAIAFPPALVWLGFAGLACWRFAGWKLATFIVGGLLLLINQDLWLPTVETLALTLTATVLSLLVAVPLGIALGENDWMERWLDPFLDFIQTMPRFVYLIPAVILFGIDVVPAVFATMTLAIVPPARVVSVAIRQVDGRIVEAATAFGAGRLKVLFDVKLPLIKSALLLAVNQCLMMSLSMAVITALIGAGGLGANVLNAIAILDSGKGFIAGFGILTLAIMIDRVLTGIVITTAAQPSNGR